MLYNFIELIYNCSKWILPKYSNYYGNHLYNQHQLFTIIIKNLFKTTYWEIIEILMGNAKIIKYLKLKKLPNYSTIQKFFVRMFSQVLDDLNDVILSLTGIDCELVAIDGTGHKSDYADKYRAKIRAKSKKSYIKNHIPIDVDTRLILHYAANNCSKDDTEFAIFSIRQIKKYKPRYVLADKAYDSKLIRKCINGEVKEFDQIQLKNVSIKEITG